MHGRACVPTSGEVHANISNWEVPVKVLPKKGLNKDFSHQL